MSGTWQPLWCCPLHSLLCLDRSFGHGCRYSAQQLIRLCLLNLVIRRLDPLKSPTGLVKQPPVNRDFDCMTRSTVQLVPFFEAWSLLELKSKSCRDEEGGMFTVLKDEEFSLCLSLNQSVSNSINDSFPLHRLNTTIFLSISFCHEPDQTSLSPILRLSPNSRSSGVCLPQPCLRHLKPFSSYSARRHKNDGSRSRGHRFCRLWTLHGNPCHCRALAGGILRRPRVSK